MSILRSTQIAPTLIFTAAHYVLMFIINKICQLEMTFLVEIEQYSEYRRFQFDPVFIEYGALLQPLLKLRSLLK